MITQLFTQTELLKDVCPVANAMRDMDYIHHVAVNCFILQYLSVVPAKLKHFLVNMIRLPVKLVISVRNMR